MSAILRHELLIYHHFHIIKVSSAQGIFFFLFSYPNISLQQKTTIRKDGANKAYIENQLYELDPQSFFVEFGFKTRGYGEKEFIKAVKNVYQESNNEDFKKFLCKEYIDDDFACLKESRYIDAYWPHDALYIYLIISGILKEHAFNSEVFDFAAQSIEQSEQDYCLMWGPIIKTLFSGTVVKIKSGDTVLSDIEKSFKVDLRLGVMINQKFVDIASIEVGKRPSSSKVKEDHVKLLLEAKTIVNRIVNQFDFIHPPSLNIYSLQICGLKGDFLKTTMKAEQQYTTTRVTDRVRFPFTTNTGTPMIAFLQRLVLFREKVVASAIEIKHDVNEAIDRRSSFGGTLAPSLKKNLPNYRSWLE